MTSAPPGPARHIMSVAQTLAGGGVERALLRLAGLWVARGRRVTLLIGSDAGPLAAELPAGVERIVLGTDSYAALARAIPVTVRGARPDVLFIPGNHYTGAAAWARLRLRRGAPPIVAKVSNALVRGDLGWQAAGYRAWLRLHPRFVDALVAMTPGMAAEAVAATGMAAGRVHVIANPPALPIPGAAPVALPAGRYALGVGRLAPQKRWVRAIEAFARAAPADVRLVILGEGPERAMLEQRVAALGIGERVTLPGHAADPLPAIAGASVVVLTSDYEGVPGVLREAVALGTPVVTTESSVAVREIVTSPTLGSVVPPGDEDALDAALRQWLRSDAVRPVPSVGDAADTRDTVLPRRREPRATTVTAGNPRLPPAREHGSNLSGQPSRDDGDPASAYLALFDQLASGSSPAS